LSGFLAVFRRELRATFLSPLAGSVGALFLLLSGISNIFNLNEYLRANASLAGRFRLMGQEPQFLDLNEILLGQNLGALAFLTLIFLPLIAMSLITEEKKSGTLELLMTSPLSESALVLGKWGASLVFFLFLLVLALVDQFLLAFWGDVHLPSLLTAALGIALMAGAFLALALWLGSLTRSTLIAASSGFALMLILWLADGFTQPGAQGFPGAFLRELSALGHLAPLLRGLIDSSDLAYFVVVTLLGLDLSRRSILLLRGGRRS
jgi:ABC-2 type transport system permease protein